MTDLMPVSGSAISQVSVSAPTPGAKAAREFESILISSLLESMQKAYLSLPGEGPLTGSDNYSYLATQALGSEIAAHGGFGIAKMISRYLDTHGNKK